MQIKANIENEMILRISLILLALLAIANTRSVKNYETSKRELEEYVRDKRKDIDPRFRPHYHLAPPVGWMNDPNGFSFAMGEFHLFYQYYPYDSVWGPMHWGHASSPDLVHWKELPTALIPEDEQCFSGSAIGDSNTMVLMYTAHSATDAKPYYNETQYLAFSTDGVNFDKHRGNPVLARAPNGSPDFRDPKVWGRGRYWYVVIGSKTDDERGRVLLYRSTDLLNWGFLSVLAESVGDLGYMWECPDFFELDGKWVLLMSPQGMEEKGDRYKNVYQNGYIIGDFNYETHEFVPEVEFQEMDYGHDFYAAQTLEKEGRRYAVAWFNMWNVTHHEAEDGWAGMMTTVREMRLFNNRILMKPVETVVNLRQEPKLEGQLYTNEMVEFGQAVELFIDADLDQKIELLLDGRSGALSKVWLRWDPQFGKVVVDRGDGDVRQVAWEPIGSRTWRILLDASSMELFCGEGEVVFSSRVFPLGGWRLTNLSPQPVNMLSYSLRRSVAD